MKSKILAFLLLLLFFTGCGKKYYEPKGGVESISYNSSISDIIAFNSGIIQLKDGSIITDRGLLKFKLPKGEKILNLNENDIAVTSKDNQLIFYNFDGEKIYKKRVKEFLALATKKDNLLVTLSSTNKIKIEDISNGDTLFEKKLEVSRAINNRMAPILFYKTVIFIPTLDGRLIVVDRDSGKLLKDFAISDRPYFNNIIFLKVLKDSINGDKLIVATSSKIIAMLGKGIEKNYDMKQILTKDNRIYILTTDGRVIELDKNLNLINSKKYRYAIFSNAFIDDEYLYILEKRGYLIIDNLDLTKDVIYEIPDEIEDYSFINSKSLFYQDSYIDLKSISKP